MKNFRLGVWGHIRICPHEKKCWNYLDVSNFLQYISSGFQNQRFMFIVHYFRCCVWLYSFLRFAWDNPGVCEDDLFLGSRLFTVRF